MSMLIGGSGFKSRRRLQKQRNGNGLKLHGHHKLSWPSADWGRKNGLYMEISRRSLMCGIGLAACVTPVDAESVSAVTLDRGCRTLNMQSLCFTLSVGCAAVNEVLARDYQKSQLRWRFGIVALTAMEHLYAMVADPKSLIEGMRRGIPEALDGQFLGIPFVFDKSDPRICVIECGSVMLSKIIGMAIPRCLDDMDFARKGKTTT